jgi:pyruvate/2-oxoglutarate dehydrogenase complex dihydrolipoamide dehydrogenase (E3) component
MTEHADAVVIGMGPGGEDVAGRLAEAGLDVVGIECGLVGGECPYWGCVPSKMAIRAANLLAEARRVRGMAGEATVVPDWSPVAARIRQEATDGWDDRVAVERFRNKGGRFVRGEGRILGPGRVLAGDSEISVRRAIVVATGARPVIPPVPGLDAIPYWTNREAMEAKEVPSSLVVLGGGAVGTELGQVFARFGSRVTIVEALDRLLPADEPEAADALARALAADGIDVRVGTAAHEVRRDGHRFAVALADGSVVTGEQVLVATGRRPDPAAVGLDRVGVPADGAVPVDAHMRVAPGVWAVGDVTGVGAFTHVAYYQARIAVADILGLPHRPADYRALPRVTFTDPEVGAVGMTEAQARAAGIAVRTGLAAVPASARGWIHKAGNEGVVKLVADGRQGVLVGATAAGPAGGEVIGMLALAVWLRAPLEALAAMIYAYPTFHRAVEDALRELA